MPSVTSQLVLRLKDELTPAAKQASKALQGIQKAEGDLQKQAEKLAKATDSLANLQKLDKRLAGTTAQFDKQRQTLKELGQQILNTDGPTKKLQEAFKRTERVMQQTRESMEQQKKAAASMAKSFQEASGSPFRNFHSAEERMKRDIEATTKAISAQHRASTNLIEGQERAARRRKRISNAFSGVGALAGPVVLHGADEAYKAGAELQHRRVELTKAGMGPMAQEIEQQALSLALQFKNVTQSEIMEMGKEIRSVLSKPEEVAHVLPAIVAARSVLDARDPSGGESHALGLLVKGSEVLGAGQDPERLIKLVDGFTRAMQVMGKTINPEEVYDFAKNSRLSGARFSDSFLLTTAMSTLQELGGASSGKAANEAVGQLSAAGLGKRTGAVKLLTDIGLIKPGDVVYNNTGEVSRARKGVLHPVQGDNLLATDPDKFLYDVLLPAMEKHGITKLDDQIAAIRQIFSGSKGAQDLFGKLITQRESYAAHAAMYPQASGIAGAAQNKNDPIAAMSEVSKSLETFMGVLTSPMMLPAAHGLDALATGIGKITEAYASFAKEHPDLAMAVGTAGLAGTAATGLKLTYNLFDKVFGDGGLKGAAAAQMEAGTTLMTAATQLELAAGRLGVGGAAATVAGEAEKVAGGAGAAAGTGLFGKLGGFGTAALAFGAGMTMGLMPDMIPQDEFLKRQGLRFSREDEDRTNRARSSDADRLGHPLIARIHLHPCHLDVMPADINLWFSDFRRFLADWTQRQHDDAGRPLPWHCVWVREAYEREGSEHLHMLVPVPSHLWPVLIERIHGKYPGSEHLVRIDASWQADSTTGEITYPGFTYLLKQHHAHAQGKPRAGLIHRETESRFDASPVAPVMGLRCGTSESLGAKARKAWQAEQPMMRRITKRISKERRTISGLLRAGRRAPRETMVGTDQSTDWREPVEANATAPQP